MSFWDFFFLLMIYVPLMLVWGTALVDIFRRDDLRGVSKALWLVVVLVLPLLGTLIYLIARPVAATPRERALLDEANREFVQRYGGSDTAQQLSVLASLHDRGKLTDAEFAGEKRRVLGAGTVPGQPAAPASAGATATRV